MLPLTLASYEFEVFSDSQLLEMYSNYLQDIESGWYWEALKSDALGNVHEDFGGEKVGSVFLGTVFSLYPSGVYHGPFGPLSGDLEGYESDIVWGAALDEVAARYDMFVSSGDGPCDILLFVAIVDDEQKNDDSSDLKSSQQHA